MVLGKENLDAARWEEACYQVQALAGRVMAGVSHEIKNKLAVLVEQGSLMEELAQTAAVKGSLDPARVEKLARRLIGKIWETDEIVRRMNRFAHGSDKATGCLEARETLGLIVDLHRRAADMKPVSVVVEKDDKSVNIETRPIFLLTALYACLEEATKGAAPDSEIRTAVVEKSPEVWFEFVWEKPGPALALDCPALLEVLEARAEGLDGGRGLRLVVPAAFRCGPPPDFDEDL